MCKKIKNIYDEKLTFENLLEAHKRASKNKTTKRDLLKFNIDLETNIINIYNELKKGTYKTGKYREFVVYEPKKRIIKALPYKDRVVQQWYIEEFIKPYMFERFIKNTYACLEGRGTHKAINAIQKYMRIMHNKYGNYYILKCDVKKYFYTIDKGILFNILKKYINDKKILKLTSIILDDGNDIGIPIGNYTSQWYANIYLNELDHYIKDVLHIKYYVRYMDDFICLFESKDECKDVLNKVILFLKYELNLELNHKSRYYPNNIGINFCGYRVYENYRLLRTRYKRKINKKIKLWNKLYSEKRLDSHKVLLCYNSLKAHASHADSYKFMKKINEKLEFKI